MGSEKYTIGLDFGTESGRAVLVSVETGEEIATVVCPYEHGVIDEHLPGSDEPLPPDFALQNPQDYLDVLQETLSNVVEKSGVAAEDVIGIGVDFTACTMFPIDEDDKPLCTKAEWRDDPHAWVKLWKHHGAEREAQRMNQVARERGEEWLDLCGGRVSSEWMFPKIWETLNHAPEVYDAADRFIEAADWIVLQLTGVEKRGAALAGYKALWSKRRGYPDEAFFAALDPRLRNVVDEKLSRDIYPLGEKAGVLTEEMAKSTGLRPGIAVAVATIDGHASVPAAGVTEPGRMAIIIGTSGAHMTVGEEEKMVEGMCGLVEDGIIPGAFGFESGQSCVGDHFAWFVENGVPAAYQEEAERQGIDVYQLLEIKAAQQEPGEHGLLALDWWNGNRSVLMDGDLTGLLLGATLNTKPEDIYRALIEATAYGTRVIIEAFEESDVPVDEIVACGGLPERNKLLMQIYADVTGRSIKIADTSQSSALGSAMFAALAAGEAAGGYDSIVDAARNMTGVKDEVYVPDPERNAVYDQIYVEYLKLHDYFGRGENDVMKRLKALKLEALGLS